MKQFKLNHDIQWKWMGRMITGKVKEIYTEPIVKEIKTKKIKRNGSPENPAYLVESKAGNLALKLHSELTAVKASSYKGPKPTMFGDD